MTSCSETFCEMFPKLLSYKIWSVIFNTVTLIIANLGLNAIIKISLPVLMFLYPLAITLILLVLTGRLFSHSKYVYISTAVLTLIAAVYDFLAALPKEFIAKVHLGGVIEAVGSVLPLSGVGLGWLLPAASGVLIGLVIWITKGKPAEKQPTEKVM